MSYRIVTASRKTVAIFDIQLEAERYLIRQVKLFPFLGDELEVVGIDAEGRETVHETVYDLTGF